MPRIRSTKPSFFRHEELQSLEMEYPGDKVMLFFSALWGLCDNQGVFEWKPNQMKLDILPFIPYNPERTLLILGIHGYIEKFKFGDEFYGHVITLKKHQRFSGKEAKDGSKFPLPTPENIISIENWEATGKQRGSNREAILQKLYNIDNQDSSRGSNGEAMGKHLRTQEKEKEKEKEKEINPISSKMGVEEEFIKTDRLKPSDYAIPVGGKKRTPAPKKNKPGVEPFQEMFVFEFEQAWKKIRQTEKKFNFQPKDFKAIKDLSKVLRKDFSDDWTRDVAKEKFNEFMELAKLDSFISKNNFENFTLPFFINRINSISTSNKSNYGRTNHNKTSPGKTITFDKP